ncbi:MAG: hypothetical protein WBZ29_16265 [Methanocella sp.]
MNNIGVDIKSLMASAFLISSLYVFYRSGTASVSSAIIELGFICAIGICLYFSYQLMVAISRMPG